MRSKRAKKNGGNPEIINPGPGVGRTQWQGSVVESYIRQQMRRTGDGREMVIATILAQVVHELISGRPMHLLDNSNLNWKEEVPMNYWAKEHGNARRSGVRSHRAARPGSKVTLTAAELAYCKAEAIPPADFLKRKLQRL